LEADQRNPPVAHKFLDSGDEPSGYGFNLDGGGNGIATMLLEKAQDSFQDLQARYVNVQIHAVDAFNFQNDMLTQDLGDTLW
jgi:hypothetical protein